MVLHEHDYDVTKTIEFLFEGGDLSHDWKTAGKHNKQKTTSPNQTLDETENLITSNASHQQHPRNQNNNKHNRNEIANDVRLKESNSNAPNSRTAKGENKQNRKLTSPKYKKKENNETNLDEKFNNLNLNSQENDTSK
jgi:hypothetical protein